jgi:adenylate cyclase
VIFTNLWMRRYDEAIRAGESAIANNPNDAEAFNGLGVVLHYVGRSEEALRHFERAMALNPLCPGMWLHFQGQVYYQLRRYEEAENVLKRRIFRTPETDASRVLLAATYGQTGRLDEAREQWREVLRVNPDYSLEHRRKVLPYKDPADFERVAEGLRKASLVE